ncbi:MAG: hypothetical protein Q9220_004789, partial [cf. Caloplaca sp. 1 TL-2023]
CEQVQYCNRRNITFLVQSRGNGWADTFHLGDCGLLINLAGLDSITINESKDRAIVQGGALVQDMNTAAYGNDTRFAVPTCTCLGYFGAVLGGGINRMMGLYGLGVDQILSVNVVTASGHLHRVDSNTNRDLWYALRGAAANFGIVTSAVVKAYPIPKAQNIAWQSTLTFPNTKLETLVEAIRSLDLRPEMEIDFLFSVSPDTKQPTITAIAFYLGPASEGEKAFASILDVGPTSTAAQEIPYSHWGDWSNTFCVKGGRKPVYGASIGVQGLKPTTWRAVFEVFKAFVTTHPEAAAGSSVLAEYYSIARAVEIGQQDPYSSYPLRDVPIHVVALPVYTDESLDVAANAFGSRVRELLWSDDGLEANSTALPLVQSNQLRRVLLRSSLLAKSKILENFAYTTPERNRVFGGPGHNATVNYLYDQVSALGGYYDVEFQPFVELYTAGNASVKVAGVDQGAQLFTYSPSGKFTEGVVAVANLGCDAADYPATVAGKIALISRGTCQFGLKSALAGAAGADAAIIYDNIDEPSLAGTLGAPPRPEGPYVPTAGISLAKGTALKNALAGGAAVTADINVISIMENRTTYNVIAQTSGGDSNNVLVLTAHTDSVDAGPGINDNGSGSIGLLEVAIQLAKFSTNNAIRFVWVSAEEFGLLGSEYYVASLSAAEKAKIRLNLNFDMIASPNYKYGIYDGDGSTFNVTGAPGSAEAEKLFQDYFTNDAGLKWVPEEFDGRSDYAPFADAGIAAGGLFTGAEGIKTAEEQVLFGGQAGVAYDVNYHGAGDNVKNLNMDAFIQNDKAIAHAVATYGRSFDSLPPKVVPRAVKREEKARMRSGRFDKYLLED